MPEKTRSERIKENFKYLGKNITEVILPVIGLCGLSGIIVGLLVGFFNYGAKILVKYSKVVYGLVAEHLAFLPLLLLGLGILAIAMAYLHKWAPETRGSGIPQTEGMMRGMVGFKPLRMIVGMIAGSAISFFAGLPVGAEGPSVQIGASTSQAVSNMFKSKLAWQRYVISAGAGAAFAVAFAAPLSGLVFVLEEGHRRFSPVLLLSTVVSITLGFMTHRLMGTITGLWNADYAYFGFADFEVVTYRQILTLIGVGVFCGISAIIFNYLLIHSQRGSDKQEKTFPYWARLLVIFIIVGITGVFFNDVNYSGFDLIHAVSIRSFDTWMLLLLLVVKFSLILLCFNSGATGGLFIPMLSVGALIGAIVADLGILSGYLDPAYYVSVVCIGMTTFFGASVRAPLTAIVLIVELSNYEAKFLPPMISIITAFIIAEIFGSKPLYDSMLERLKKIFANYHKVEMEDIDIEVVDGAFISGKKISDILWPIDTLVVSVQRGDEKIVPDGGTIVRVGDVLTIQVETGNKERTTRYLNNLITG